MGVMNFHYRCRLDLVLPAAALGGTALPTASLDMTGYDSVAFFGGKMSAVAGNSVNLAISGDDVTFTDLAEATVVPTADGNTWQIDVHRPLGGRHIRAEIDRSGTDTTVGDVWAVRYNAGTHPVAQPATMNVVFVNAPEP